MLALSAVYEGMEAMRSISRLLAGGAALVLAAVLAAPALADPPSGVTPRPGDVVGVGSDTIEYLLDQFSHDYSAAHPHAASLLYSFDETNPDTGAVGDPIQTKAGCADIPRPDGSSAGISAVEADTTDPADPSDYCIDFAGSSRGPLSSDPRCVPGGICFIELVGDALTWASRAAASGGTDAPTSLTVAQLKSIYECKDTNWKQVGGKNAAIEAFLPQASSGVRTSWLTALGITKPGSCIGDDDNTLQDDEGTNPVLDSPEAIVPYSVADYIAQVYHSARCKSSSCTGSPPCTPEGSQNRFGCDQHGVLTLNEIDGLAPVSPWPLPSPPCPACAINTKFAPQFQQVAYLVVRYAATSDHVPAYIEPFISSSGYLCTGSLAKKTDQAYGFVHLGNGKSGADVTPGCGTGHG